MHETTPAIQVEIVGASDPSTLELHRLLEQFSPAVEKLLWTLVERPSPAADAVLIALPAHETGTNLRQVLAPIADRINEMAARRGRQCQVAGFPVFVVLTQCHLLAHPSEPFEDWLERVETRKRQIGRLFEALLGPTEVQGFGAIQLHLWATAPRRPNLPGALANSEDPFGIRELVWQVVGGVRDRQRRQARQARRLRLLVTLSITAVLALVLMAVVFWLAGSARSEKGPGKPQPWEPGELLVQGEKLLTKAQKLVAFQGYMQTVSMSGQDPARSEQTIVVDWHRWQADAEQVLAEAAELRGRLSAERVGETLSTQLQRAEQELQVLLLRASALGLTASDNPMSAWLLFRRQDSDWPKLQADLHARLAWVTAVRIAAVQRPLPGPVPVAVADLLRMAAAASLENLLDPVRKEIHTRLMQHGGDQETVQAWKELAEGWLANQAESDLYTWRQFAVLLATLAGDTQPTEPLAELKSFLRRKEFALPLERVVLHIPERLTVGERTWVGLKPTPSPLTITVESGPGTKTVLDLLPLSEATPQLLGPGNYTFATTRQSPLAEGRLVVQPGDRISARVRLVDAEGNPWDLVWATADSPSRVYTQAVLTQAPQIRDPRNPSGLTAPMAFGIRLHFAEPGLFELPKLFPR